ncbi:MAG TPA: hypothetical protein VF960_09325 [Chloroflexota bacterium]
MISHKDLIVQGERFKDFAREIESDRLAEMALDSPRRAPFFARGLAWFGHVLSSAGSMLERRYGEREEIYPSNVVPISAASDAADRNLEVGSGRLAA